MQRDRIRALTRALLPLFAALFLATPGASEEEEPESFQEKLARVEEGMRKNPRGVVPHARNSCASKLGHAVRLYRMMEEERAQRALDYCLQVLKLSKTRPHKIVVEGPNLAELETAAARELEGALGLEPDIAHGLEIYRECARCHTPEGHGLKSGIVPQIAGQHQKVVIKQLADIRAGHRKITLMNSYATLESIGGVQSLADVAGYIDTLEIGTDVGMGPGDALEKGEKLYGEGCASCHGARGGGDDEAFVPRIHSQHFNYLVAQLEWIQSGRRGNANPAMQAIVKGYSDEDVRAVADYVSRLEPPEELQAPPGWKNPDFAE